jgi:transposase
LTTKIHALVDGLGMLARFRLTGGQAGDSPEALSLLDDLKPASLAADKAYDSNAILQHLESAGIQAVIPSRANRLEQRPLDEHLYASRNLVERFFCRIKQFRRIATRYDKLSERPDVLLDAIQYRACRSGLHVTVHTRFRPGARV